MDLENEADEDKAFDDAFNAVVPDQDDPAPETESREDDPQPEPVSGEADKPEPKSKEEPEEDELAGMPPKVRALLAEIDALRKAASIVPGLEQRLRQAEGRLGDLNGRIPKPQPPAPPKLERWEALREQLPEMADGLEELLQHRLPPKAEPEPKPEQPQEPQSAPTPTLDKLYPSWGQTVQGDDFKLWLASQDEAYRAGVMSTDSEAEFIDALAKFTSHQRAMQAAAQAAAARQVAANQVSQVRLARAASAAVPQGSGRRAPVITDEDDAFDEGFRNAR